jgi:hypothetical protein
MPRELSVVEQGRVRSMVTQRQHPDRIDAYLQQRGIPNAEIPDVYTALNLRRSHLLDCYRMKRNVRIVGLLMIAGSVSVPVFHATQASIVVSLGLLVYGIALAVTGNLIVYQP